MKKFFAILLVLLLLPAPALADLTKDDISVSTNTGHAARLVDGNRGSVWTSEDGEQFVSFHVPEDSDAKGIFIQWNRNATPWALEVSDDGERWTPVGEYGQDANQIEEYVLLPGKGIYIGMRAQSKMSIGEITLLGDDDTEVHKWELPPEQAEFMIFTTHPDDEQLYLGAGMPLYTAEQQKDTVVVYLTNPSLLRQREALEGLWRVGVRQYPQFLNLADKLSYDRASAANLWGEDKTIGLVVEQIRKYKPLVIATHDFEGEYGHGQHRMCAWAVQKAVEGANDPSFFPESAEKYGVWNTPKLYIHLYPENKITVDCQSPLEFFEGKSAFEMLKYGYTAHESQQQYWFTVEVGDKQYSIEKWGLCYTAVGPDEAGGDMFENITPEKLKEANPSYYGG